MKKKVSILIIVFALFGVKQSNANELLDLLMNKLGVTELQANAGTGVLLNYLKSQVSGEDFQTVSDGIEDGAGSYIKASEDAGAYKKSVSRFGKATAPVTAPGLVANTTESFQKLGLKTDQIVQFADVIFGYLKDKGKDKAARIFAKMLDI